MSSNRILWVDNLKGFLILLVVLGHTIQYSMQAFDSSHVFNYIYSFHMPLFFLISGFVSYKSSLSSTILGGAKKRGVQLLLPYVFWGILFCILTGMTIERGLFVSPVFWFLILLFFISVLMSVCQWVSSRIGWKSEVVCCIMVILLFVIQGLFKPNFLSLHILHIHFFFYTIGWYLRKYEAKMLMNWMLIPSAVGFAVLGWFYQRGAMPSSLSIIPPSIYFLASGIVGSWCFLLLFRRYINMSLPLLGCIGRLTLGIYVIHLVACGYCETIMKSLTENSGGVWGVTTLFVVISIVTILISFLLSKSKYTCFLIGLKYKFE